LVALGLLVALVGWLLMRHRTSALVDDELTSE
jgi:hypothetical protein